MTQEEIKLWMADAKCVDRKLGFNSLTVGDSTFVFEKSNDVYEVEYCWWIEDEETKAEYGEPKLIRYGVQQQFNF